MRVPPRPSAPRPPSGSCSATACLLPVRPPENPLADPWVIGTTWLGTLLPKSLFSPEVWSAGGPACPILGREALGGVYLSLSHPCIRPRGLSLTGQRSPRSLPTASCHRGEHSPRRESRAPGRPGECPAQTRGVPPTKPSTAQGCGREAPGRADQARVPGTHAALTTPRAWPAVDTPGEGNEFSLS